MYINEIRKKYNNGDYTYNVGIPEKVQDDYIFDEELSIKRNKELIKEHNQKVDELRAEAYKQQNLLYWQLTEDIVSYIVENYYLNEVQARKVECFFYQEYHSFMCDYFSKIDTFAEFAETLINCGG